jgi:hypothetical protein
VPRAGKDSAEEEPVVPPERRAAREAGNAAALVEVEAAEDIGATAAVDRGKADTM